MKISTVKQTLEQYDQNKGISRTYVKEEPHIRELREFVETLDGDERELIASEHLKLAKILIGKNTINQSESSKAFNILVKFFGGYEGLAELNQHEQLTRKNVALLIKKPKFAKELSNTIVVIASKKIEADILDALIKIFENIKQPEHVVFTLELMKLRCTRSGFVPYIEALRSLNNQGFNTEDVAKCLSNRKDIAIMKTILLFIEKFGSTLLHQKRLNTILELQRLGLFAKLLSRFEITSDIIDILCGIETQLKLHPLPGGHEEFYAFEMATMFIALHKARCFSEQTCEAMLAYPQCLETNTKLLNYLTDNNLHGNDNVVKIGKLGFPDNDFLAMLEILKKADLLNHENIQTLFDKSSFRKTLLSALRCLLNGCVLNQERFMDITCNPVFALSIAEEKGGKICTESQPWVQDKGALNFIEIRKDARVLALLNDQNLLFAPMTSSNKDAFFKATKRTISELQKSSLLKIAEYCGDGSLELEAEQNIARNGYFTL